MRLTLRTMLAYLDDILEPSDSEDIGHKIEESEFASGIVNRIHDCLRRLRLGVPYLNGRGMGGDPNTVAEYLDNTMAPDLVPEFEKVCLESDSHLAEVAACHQILTLVLGEPADVDPNSRQRMYGLIHQPEPQPAEPAEVRAREPQPLVTPAQRHRPEVPDYLREQDRRNETKGRSWFKIAAAILLLAMLGCIGFAGVVFRDQFMAAVPAEGEAKNNAVREVQSQPTAHVPTDESATPLEAEPGSEPVGHTRAANDLSEDGAQPPVGDSTAKDVSPSASDTSDATPAGTDAGVEERGNMTEPATATVDGSAAPAVDALAGTPTTDTSVAPTSDTAATPPAIGGGQIGRYVSDGQVLLRFQSPDDWVRVPARDPLSNNEVLVSLPLFRSTLAFGTGVTVQVMDSSKVELDGPDAQGVPGLRIGFGRVVLMNSGNTNARIRLAIADQFGELVLNEASTVAGLEVLPVLVDGVDPVAQPATIQTILYANTGSVIWRAPGQAQDETIAAPAIRSWTGQVADQPTAGQELPVWLNGELKLNDAERRAAEFLLTSIETDRSARLGLIEISDNRRRFEAKALAVRGLGLIDSFEPLIAALGDPLQRSAWPDHVAALRAALARGPETAAQVRDACEKRRPEHGAELYRLLWGYTEEQLNQGADEQLVGYLDDPDPDLDLRVVAIWNLEHITGEARGYRPQDQLALRQPQVRRWKLWLKNRGAAGGAAS